MAETRKPKMKSYSPMALADRANDKFLSIARSAGKAARFMQSSITGGLLKIWHALSGGKREEKTRQPGRTRKIKESVPTDEWPEEHEDDSPSEVKTESDVD